MEDIKFNPETHRKDYGRTEKELLEVKADITGEKSNAELAELIAKRDALTINLEAQEAEARDHADEDDENLTDASAQIEKLKKEIEGYKDQIAEITGTTKEEREGGVSPELAETITHKEIEGHKDQIAEITGTKKEEREGGVSPELAETIARLKDAGYLDTSFEGKEFHPLTIRPLTKEQALDEYKKSSGKTWIWDELEKNMPYTVPKAESLDVMIINFGNFSENIGSDEALAEMNRLGVRPLTYEELIQYGIEHPEHQKQKYLPGLGTKYSLDGNPCAPVLRFGVGDRGLRAFHWGSVWGGSCRFPVVRK